jgi:hypothetical protein
MTIDAWAETDGVNDYEDSNADASAQTDASVKLENWET